MILQWILPSCCLILVVLAVRALLGQRISARFRYALWAVVLTRLLVPVQLFTLPEVGDSLSIVQSAAKQMEERADYVLPVLSIPEDEVQADETPAGVRPEDGFRAETEGAARDTYANKITPVELFQVLWAAGGTVLALLVLAGNLHFYARLRRMRKRLEGTGCRIPVYVVEHLPSPCLFGVLRPSIYVTAAAAENPVILYHVLSHEMTHYRHKDHIWSLLRGTALAIHWWNPLVWLAVVLSRRDSELACDEGALKRLGREERTAYGETLLFLVTAKPGTRDLFSCAATMLGEKRSLRERISRISREPKHFISAALAAVLIVSLTSACAFGKPAETELPVVPPRQEEEESGSVRTQPVLSGSRKEGVYTFLIVGSDASGNADTLMVVSYDTAKQDISVMSIPRDTAVNDNGSIDAVKYIYGKNGMDALKKSIGRLIGFTPDYYVKIHQDMLAQFVDLLGGVMFDVPQDMDYDDPFQNLHIHLRKGVQTLDGEQAMGLVRFRRYKDGDIARVEVQQDFFKALIKESLSLKNWKKVTEYIDLALENTETDLDYASMEWFAFHLLGWNDAVPALSLDDIYTCTMPGDYWAAIMMPGQHPYKQSVTVSYPDQVAELVNEKFNPYQQEITASMLDQVILPQEDIF